LFDNDNAGWITSSKLWRGGELCVEQAWSASSIDENGGIFSLTGHVTLIGNQGQKSRI